MTYKEIQELNGIQPYGFESNREEQWYECGLVEGADVAYEQAEKDLMEKAEQFYVDSKPKGNAVWEKCLRDEFRKAMSELK